MTYAAVRREQDRAAGHMHRCEHGFREAGFTYVAMLFAVALISVGLGLAVPIYSEQVRREREQELIRVGTLYVEAIRNYYLSSPGSVRMYPRRLEDLILDARFVGTRRHLRKLYWDPIMRSAQWGVVPAPDGGVAGVYSRSEQAPLLARPLLVGSQSIAPPARYSDLKFVFEAIREAR